MASRLCVYQSSPSTSHCVLFWPSPASHVPQNNARAHTTRATRDFPQQHNIRIMPWPAFSSDLNPIEHLWNEIQRKLNEVRPRPMTTADLEDLEVFYLTTHSTHFCLRLYGVGHMVNDHSDSERGNSLPPHWLVFPINSKGSFICTTQQTDYYITQPLLHQSWSTGWNEK